MKKKIIACCYTCQRRIACTPAPAHWIAAVTSFPRNDEVHGRHCKESAAVDAERHCGQARRNNPPPPLRHCEEGGSPTRQSSADRQTDAQKAFSLIELLVSLIIISLIAAAFVPMLTKNIKHKELALATKSASLDCAEFDAEGRCLMCSKDTGCSLCSTQLEALEGKYVYPPDGCDYKNCAVGCKKCTHEGCISCHDGYAKLEDNSCKKCSDLFGAYCKTCNTNTCSSCINSNYMLSANKKSCIEAWVYPSVENCARVDSIFIAGAYNAGKNVCVTKRNLGDLGTLQIPSTAGVTIVRAATSDRCSGKCCWTGNTAATACTGLSGFDYSGCNRTACNWEAANAICANFHFGNGILDDSWRLPSYSEFAAWVNNLNAITKNKGTQGLQLCDHFSGYGSPRCHYRTGDCNNVTSSSCRLHHLWGQQYSSTSAYQAWLESGVMKIGIPAKNQNADGVRCVIEKYRKTY